jgi:hypothetical protein
VPRGYSPSHYALTSILTLPERPVVIVSPPSSPSAEWYALFVLAALTAPNVPPTAGMQFVQAAAAVVVMLSVDMMMVYHDEVLRLFFEYCIFVLMDFI